MAQKVYRLGYVEAWMGFKLSTDAELMYSAIGMQVNPADVVPGYDFVEEVLGTYCYGELKACLPSDWALQGGFCLFGVDTGTDPDFLGTPPEKWDYLLGPTAGTRGPGGSAVQNTAVLVHKAVTHGRGGRMYLPGVSEAGVNPNGSISSEELSIWTTALASMVAGITGATGVIGLAKQSTVVGQAYTSTQVVTGLVIDPVVATQRRRLRR